MALQKQQLLLPHEVRSFEEPAEENGTPWSGSATGAECAPTVCTYVHVDVFVSTTNVIGVSTMPRQRARSSMASSASSKRCWKGRLVWKRLRFDSASDPACSCGPATGHTAYNDGRRLCPACTCGSATGHDALLGLIVKIVRLVGLPQARAMIRDAIVHVALSGRPQRVASGRGEGVVDAA